MARTLFALLLAAGMVSGCGPATADNDAAPVASVAADTASAPTDAAAAAPTDAAPSAPAGAVAGSCGGGPGGSCCGGADGKCSQMAETDDPEGGCPCQRRKRLIEKARAAAAASAAE